MSHIRCESSALSPRTPSSSSGGDAAATSAPNGIERGERGEDGDEASDDGVSSAASTTRLTSGSDARMRTCSCRALRLGETAAAAAAGARERAFLSSPGVCCIAAMADIHCDAAERLPASITSRQLSSSEPPAE